MYDADNNDRNDNDNDTNGATDMGNPIMLMILSRPYHELVECLPAEEAMQRFSTHGGDDYMLVKAPAAVNGDVEKQCTERDKWNSTVAKADKLYAAGWEFHYQTLPVGWDTPPPKDEPEDEATSKFSLQSTTKHGVVSQAALDRIEKTNAVLEKHGVKVSESPIFASGRRTSAWGDDNLKNIIDEHNSDPDVVDILRDLWRTVHAEGRRDIVVDKPHLLRMNDDGTLICPVGTRSAVVGSDWKDFEEAFEEASPMAVDTVQLEPNGLGSLLKHLGQWPHGNGYLRRIDTKLRAHNFNERMKRTEEDDFKPFRIRSRYRSGTTESGWAAVNTGFPTVADTMNTITKIAQALKPLGLEGRGEGEGIKGEVIYDPSTTKLSVSALVAPNNWTDPATNDVFKAGFRVDCRDDGKGGWELNFVAFRNHCENFIIVVQDSSDGVLGNKGWHNRSNALLLENMEEALAQGVEFMEDFIALWGLSTKVDAADVLGIDLTDEEHGLRGPARKFYEAHEDDPRSRIIAEIISRPEMKAEVATDVLCEAILQGWDLNDAEGRDTSGMSVNDLINAVTYVHQTNMVDAIVADQMAHAGGALLRQLVADAPRSIEMLTA